MKGLLWKDACIMIKQTKVFLVLVVALALMPNRFLYPYALFYAAMLPITALAYDERSKWNKLADMMPYSAGEIVACKYVMGYFLVGCVFILTAAGKLVFAAAGYGAPGPAEWAELALTACMAVILQAVNLPIMFWIGVEKGRLLFILFGVCSIFGAVTFLEGAEFSGAKAGLPLLALCAAVFAVLASLISCLVAKRLYQSRKCQG